MIVVVDYGVGNLRSIAKALEAAGADVRVTASPAHIRDADRIVLPGVGAFGACMSALEAAGLIDVLDAEVRRGGKPFLGVCVGMQMLADTGLENGEHRGLGWVHGTVRPLLPDGGLKVPHVGWNDVAPRDSGALLRGFDRPEPFYFTHSYYFDVADAGAVRATTTHGRPFAAVLEAGPIAATQFHPEKSQTSGLSLLANFVSWQP